MKTPEELKELKKRINEIRNELAELSPEELGNLIEAYSLQNKAEGLSHEELAEVTGGGDNVIPAKGTNGVFFVPVTLAVSTNTNVNLSCSAAVNLLTNVIWTPDD